MKTSLFQELVLVVKKIPFIWKKQCHFNILYWSLAEAEKGSIISAAAPAPANKYDSGSNSETLFKRVPDSNAG